MPSLSKKCFGLINPDKFDDINRMITLAVIKLSGFNSRYEKKNLGCKIETKVIH
jgi:hypothetical protein